MLTINCKTYTFNLRIIITLLLIIMAGSPIICLEMVQALVAALPLLKHSSDYRPNFTMHDSEFEEYISSTIIILPARCYKSIFC